MSATPPRAGCLDRVLRLVKTTSSLVVLGVAVAGALVAAWLLRPAATRSPGLSIAEEVRARAWLAALEPRTACSDEAVLSRTSDCVRDGHADIDSDGSADCWRELRGNAPMGVWPKLVVWRGCRGEPVTFELAASGMALLMVPHELASPLWLRWIADRTVGHDRVSCVGIVDCPAPGPEWQWVLDAAARGEAEPGHHGTVAPRWSTGDRKTGGALVLPKVPDGWMQRRRGSEEPIPAESRAGARLVVEDPSGYRLGAIRCGGLDVHAEPGGIVATARGRWTWLFRGLADHGGFAASKLLCLEGLVIATTGGNFADVVAIDPATGGWLYDPGNDCCAGATVKRSLAGEYLWQRDFGVIVTVRRLRGWLALPAARRGPLRALANRPELAHGATSTASMIARTYDRKGDELWGETFEPSSVTAAMRANLGSSLRCGGEQISWGTTAMLGERGKLARWILVEGDSSTRRIASVQCIARKLRVTRVDSKDLLETADETLVEDKVEIDLARNRWRFERR